MKVQVNGPLVTFRRPLPSSTGGVADRIPPAPQFIMTSFCKSFFLFPLSVKDFDIPISVKQGRDKVREMFLKNKHVSDIRTIDLLVVKVGENWLKLMALVLAIYSFIICIFFDFMMMFVDDFYMFVCKLVLVN